jgi:hypothetical protein
MVAPRATRLLGSIGMTKIAEYAKLVAARKACHL